MVCAMSALSFLAVLGVFVFWIGGYTLLLCKVADSTMGDRS